MKLKFYLRTLPKQTNWYGENAILNHIPSFFDVRQICFNLPRIILITDIYLKEDFSLEILFKLFCWKFKVRGEN